MNELRLFPEKWRILSGSMLKLIAVISMLIDHVGAHLTPQFLTVLQIGDYTLTLQTLMRVIGRLAFPIFAFLLVEGFLHTRSRLRYGLSLFICALISEIPWDLVQSGHLLYQGQNVFFTLLLGYLALCGMDWLRKKPVLPFLVLLAFALLTLVVQADYGVKGYAFILLLYALRKHEVFRPLTSFLLSRHWAVMCAFLPISLYNGKRGFIKSVGLKYAFYLFYPVHLFVIYLIKYQNVIF